MPQQSIISGPKVAVRDKLCYSSHGDGCGWDQGNPVDQINSYVWGIHSVVQSVSHVM